MDSNTTDHLVDHQWSTDHSLRNTGIGYIVSVVEWLRMVSLKGIWRKQSWINQGTVLAFAWRDWVKLWKTPFQVVLLLTSIWKMLGFSLGWHISYGDWNLSWFSLVPPYECCDDLFFHIHSNSVFINYPTIQCYMVCATDSVIK
jgi:hypothetical protein